MKSGLIANGRNGGAGRLPRAIPNKFSRGAGADVGTDLGSGVDFTYKLPVTMFTQRLGTLTLAALALVSLLGTGRHRGTAEEAGKTVAVRE